MCLLCFLCDVPDAWCDEIGFSLMDDTGIWQFKPSTLSVVDKAFWFIYSKSVVLVARVSARALNKRFTIQRRLAWSLCKDDTQNRREANLFFCFTPLPHKVNCFVLQHIEQGKESVPATYRKSLFNQFVLGQCQCKQCVRRFDSFLHHRVIARCDGRNGWVEYDCTYVPYRTYSFFNQSVLGQCNAFVGSIRAIPSLSRKNTVEAMQ